MKVYLKDNLKWLREKTGFTQQTVADKINIKKNTYGNYETGYSSPDFLILKRLSNEFGYSVDELLYHSLEADPAKPDASKDGGKIKKNIKELAPAEIPYPVTHPNVYELDGKSEAISVLSHIEEKIQQLPGLYQPRLGPGLHVRLQLVGDSMHSTIKDNDFVIATYVAEAPYNDIREGSIYVLVDEDEGVICKRVYLSKDDAFELVSDNGTYKPYRREKKCILAMYKVVQVQSSDLKNYNTDKELMLLWKKIHELSSGKI